MGEDIYPAQCLAQLKPAPEPTRDDLIEDAREDGYSEGFAIGYESGHLAALNLPEWL